MKSSAAINKVIVTPFFLSELQQPVGNNQYEEWLRQMDQVIRNMECQTDGDYEWWILIPSTMPQYRIMKLSETCIATNKIRLMAIHDMSWERCNEPDSDLHRRMRWHMEKHGETLFQPLRVGVSFPIPEHDFVAGIDEGGDIIRF